MAWPWWLQVRQTHRGELVAGTTRSIRAMATHGRGKSNETHLFSPAMARRKKEEADPTTPSFGPSSEPPESHFLSSPLPSRRTREAPPCSSLLVPRPSTMHAIAVSTAPSQPTEPSRRFARTPPPGPPAPRRLHATARLELAGALSVGHWANPIRRHTPSCDEPSLLTPTSHILDKKTSAADDLLPRRVLSRHSSSLSQS